MIELIVLICVSLIVFFKLFFEKVTIIEYEKGLKYVKGKYQGILDAGQYWHFNFHSIINKVDMRDEFVSIPGQEILSADGITLKISLSAKYCVADPSIAINKVEDFKEAFYVVLQLALREIISSMSVEEILEKRPIIGEKLVELSTKEIEKLGLKLHLVNIRDVMFPGDLKKIFSQALKAKYDGIAALEKARGETAALRNLANVSKLLEAHPGLLQLRLLQSMSETPQNTLVVGMPALVPVQKNLNLNVPVPGDSSIEE